MSKRSLKTKMNKRFLNVEYNNIQVEIDLKDMERFSELQKEVLVAFKEISLGFARVQLWNKTAAPSIQFNDLDDIKALPEQYFWKRKQYGSLSLTVQLLSPPVSVSAQSPLIGQVLSITINQSKLIKKYLTPVGSSPTTPVENSPTNIDLATIGLQLDQLFYKNTTARPCIVVDVQRDYDFTLSEIVPSFTIVLITGFDGKPLGEVMAEEEFKRVMPIHPTTSLSGTAAPINTTPEWMSHAKHKIPSYVLCIPIKVYAQNLRRFEDSFQLDEQNLQKLKLHILALGGINANADFVDSEEEDSDDDSDEDVLCTNFNRIVTWDEISV